MTLQRFLERHSGSTSYIRWVDAAMWFSVVPIRRRWDHMGSRGACWLILLPCCYGSVLRVSHAFWSPGERALQSIPFVDGFIHTQRNKHVSPIHLFFSCVVSCLLPPPLCAKNAWLTPRGQGEKSVRLLVTQACLPVKGKCKAKKSKRTTRSRRAHASPRCELRQEA